MLALVASRNSSQLTVAQRNQLFDWGFANSGNGTELRLTRDGQHELRHCRGVLADIKSLLRIAREALVEINEIEPNGDRIIDGVLVVRSNDGYQIADGEPYDAEAWVPARHVAVMLADYKRQQFRNADRAMGDSSP